MCCRQFGLLGEKKMIIDITSGGNSTRKIQNAIDECFLAGGGEVRLEKGEHYSGGLRLRSNVTLRLLSGARLIGSRDPKAYYVLAEDVLEPIPEAEMTNLTWDYASSSPDGEEPSVLRYAGSRWNNALIRLVYARNAAIIGEKGSVIDGCDPYDELGEENYRGPHGINAFYCENIYFSGYTISNTGNWAHAVFHSANLVFSDITVLAGHDGVHITDCENVRISDCGFYTGDDCVAGFANRNVTIRNCELNTACSAFRFGGTNVYVEKCHVFGPARYVFRGSLTKEEKISGAHPKDDSKHRFNMLSLFTYYADHTFSIPVAPGNIIISDCRVENVDRFLHFNYSGNERWQKNRPLEDITFTGIEATGISMPLTAYGDNTARFTLRFTHSSIDFSEEVDVPFMHVANYRLLELSDLRIRRSGSSPLILSWGGDGTFTAEDVVCSAGAGIAVTPADIPFVCKPI